MNVESLDERGVDIKSLANRGGDVELLVRRWLAKMKESSSSGHSCPVHKTPTLKHEGEVCFY